ncbi:MAG: 7-carboxy-7-deazaguanine synthase QueE [Alistipes sp.]|jgi:organic radical activating enzyme|nr:7-carboxy-7-deazaguanine synthase QueE [Alistipes sp.]
MKINPDIELLQGGRLLPLVEDFYTVQGEGYHSGKPAYFIRLGGCDVGCHWCDAKYTWNAKMYPPTEITTIVNRAVSCAAQAIVITGGEPLLYPLEELTRELHAHGLEIFIETSGTHPISGEFDWICLSPKRQMPPLEEALCRADELKVIIQSKEDLEWAVSCSKKVRRKCRLYVQPEWSVYEKIIGEVVEWVKEHPEWNISIQAHKFMHIP